MIAQACFMSGVNNNAFKNDNKDNNVLVHGKVMNYVVVVTSELYTSHIHQVLQSHQFRH